MFLLKQTDVFVNDPSGWDIFIKKYPFFYHRFDAADAR
jgi:hypothetical protein